MTLKELRIQSNKSRGETATALERGGHGDRE